MPQHRREFLKTASAVSLGFLGLQQFITNPLFASTQLRVGYGDLIPDKKKILDLPKGFRYSIISQRGKTMTDGFYVPGRPDGMATFQVSQDKLIIIRNHENSPDDYEDSPYGKNYALLSKLAQENFYDFGRGNMPSLGGTTTLVFNERTQKVEKEFLSLAGTNRNCAGGKTPWNSWISCEEDVNRADDTAEKNHGFNFEVPANEHIALAKPIPIKEMGRFNHEAICVDPRSNIIYQTEDTHDGLIYRFIPNDVNQLTSGGKLQALAVHEQKSLDTRNWQQLNTPKIPLNARMEVYWIDLEEVESPMDDLRLQGFEKGAARFARGEGMWFGNQELYFACTNGGHNQKGQVFRYIPSLDEGKPEEAQNPGILELFAEPNNTEIVKNCDNLTVAPWGDVILCEDDPDSYLIGLTPKGEFYRLAHNVGFKSELAGVTFSPSGKTLFVNIQDAGLTLAITGPWK